MGKVEKPDTDQQQFWKMAIETWQSSGLSVRQFCNQEGLSEPAFYSWRKKLSAKNECPPKSSHKDTPLSDNFIRVSLPTQNSCSIELVLASGHLLRIGTDVDSKVLTGVLMALKQAKLC